MTEGERWTRETLAELRGARFVPRAWHRFLAASLERSAAARSSHRTAHRQVLALAAAGVVGWVVIAFLGRPGLALAGVVWLGSLSLMVDWHLGMVERADGSVLRGLGLANEVTLVRAATIPAVFALGEPALLVALVVFAALDVLDGAIARRLDERTRLGAWLDGSTDTITGLAIALAASRLGAVPLVLAGLIVARVAIPWFLLTWSYFVSTGSSGVAADLREPSVAARAPGAVAAGGLALALAGIDGGVAVAFLGVAASIVQILVAAAAGKRTPGAGGRQTSV